MPYSNVPEKKWGDMDRCVDKVMSEHEGEKDFTKQNAIAICHNSIMGEINLAASVTLEIVDDPTELNLLLGQRFEKGELLRWKGAELARAEVNANRDELDNQNIEDLAATLPLMPLTNEHSEVVGVFTASEALPDSENPDVERLLTDGVMYARRFEKVADEIMSGTKRLSIEAVAEQAICSVCGESFVDAALYCDHLQNRHASGAIRSFKNIRAVGGGAVRRPAASQAGFDTSRVYMIASHQEREGEREVDSEEHLLLMWYAAMDFGDDQPEDLIAAAKEKWSKDIDLDEGSLKALGWPSGEKIANAISQGKVSYAKAIQKLGYLANVSKDSATVSKAKSIMKMLRSRFKKNESKGGSMELEQVQQELADAVAKLEAAEGKIEELQNGNAELEASLATANESLENARAENEQLEAARIEQERRSILASVMSVEEFDENKDVIMAMDDAAVKLMAERAAPAETPSSPTTLTAGADDDDDKDVYSLA